ncbi:MAG: prepilin-type N-terminal cleavage/methylation domain-containing protein [Bacteriovorax sp.]|nr:prepilin-type N-terminal cleavage/methylation domain-containing protein [Bacteriovorax sp.]
MAKHRLQKRAKAIMRLHLNKKFFILLNNKQGFTLIEILVALFLIVLVMSLSLSTSFSSRADLDQEVSSIERAIRFMSDEAALKNAVVRLHFILDKDPQEYAVEYGPSDTFILPPKPEYETKVETKEEEEKKKKTMKDINLKFNKIAEFQDKNSELPDHIKIIGVATPQSQKLQTKGEVSIYTYPTGEKDEALVILGSEEDIISIKVNPFSMKIEHQVYTLGKNLEKDVVEKQQAKAREIFEKWQKEK